MREATLISTGEAGLEDPKHSTATKRGIFRIHTKHVSTTMSSEIPMITCMRCRTRRIFMACAVK